MSADLNFFGTFLDAWKHGQGTRTQAPGTAMSHPGIGPAEHDAGLDGILAALSPTGMANLKDLLGQEAVGSSVDGLLGRLGQMQDLGWVEVQGPHVSLTDEGLEVARRLTATA